MNNIAQATRPIMWNISEAWLMYLLMFVSLAVFGYGLYKRIIFWKQGKPDQERLSDWGKRFWMLVNELVIQKRVRSSRFPGIFHSLIFYSFVVLIITTAIVALDYDLGTSFFEGYLYVLLTVAAELAGLLILVGVGMAAWRRFAVKPESLTTTFADIWPLLLIGLMILTGFLVEGLRIAAIGDKWAALSPVGYGLSFLFYDISPEGVAQTHQVFWWLHTVLALGWIAAIPFTKFVHMLALPMNVFFAKLKPRGELSRIDIDDLMTSDDFDEESFNLGIERANDFTWKQRLDLDACISCGRCDEVCPARLCGHPFSPRDFIANCHNLLLENGNRNGDLAAESVPDESGPEDSDGLGSQIVGNVLDEEYIWYCRTCMACMEVCPACIDHVDTLVELRRNEVMIQGRAPSDAIYALKNLEARGNPFGPQNERTDWVKSLGVRVVGPGEECDVIYWIGCCTTFDPTKQQIALDLFNLLNRSGISFGILGPDERCCGDPARVLGDERLFQDVAKAQVEDLNKRSFKVLLTSCPHCYNVLKNEYPQFGGNYNVVHHSEFMHEMIWSGELIPKLGLARRVVYHDPCYLARYQRVYKAPREVLRAIPGIKLLEMRDHMDRSLCCGGGGGHYWMDIHASQHINNLRVSQAREAGADTIVTACAYCKQMLEDGVKRLDLDEEIEVIDLATLLVTSLSEERSVPKKEDEADRSSLEDRQSVSQ